MIDLRRMAGKRRKRAESGDAMLMNSWVMGAPHALHSPDHCAKTLAHRRA
ncbi:MAG: hypothetical protein AAGE86_00655 [Pseudomonadota bacterium]